MEYLQQQGVQILGRNVRLGPLEVDILARHGDVIAVVEVRTRGPGSWTTGWGSLGWQKRERLRRAGARLWRRYFARDGRVARLRFDAAVVVFDGAAPNAAGEAAGSSHPRTWVEYVPAAF